MSQGGYRIYVGGSRQIGLYLENVYSPAGLRQFDFHFMGVMVYQKPVEFILCDISEVPRERETGRPLGRHLDGCRIGFDLGATDRKVSAVVDGQAIYSEEVIWEPRLHADPEYHYREIMAALKTAASKMPRLDAIGGSSAGIYIDNHPMVASLFRSVPDERFDEIRNLFIRIQSELNVPLEVINDGDVTALAGSMSLEDNGILGIAMGSSEAAGYVDLNGHVRGWLNEMRAYFDLLHNQVRGGQHIWIFVVPTYSPAFLREAAGLFRQAEEAAAGDEALLGRIRKARLSIDYGEYLKARQFEVRGNTYEPASLSSLRERFAGLMKSIRSFGITSIHEGRQLDWGEKEFEIRMKPYRVETLQNSALLVDVAPELAGRAIPILQKENGPDLLRPLDTGERFYPNIGGLATLVEAKRRASSGR